jgi:pimeloyl-ACP methyl ester carboxylesterase
VLLDAGYTDFQDRPDYAERTLAESTAALRERTPRFASWSDVPESARATFRERGGAIVPVVPPEVVAAAAHGVAAEPPSATLTTLGRLELPILLVIATQTVAQEWGRRALERFRASVPRADVVEIASGHDLLADAPDETVAAICDWLAAAARLPGRRPPPRG